ncbi:50S ribosomal protein L31 [Vibrio vulnificus]|uniref:50S ribosomal protein L31 n=1 Tax=Vibrio vulnificus TaxID=672 RepID=UPI0024DFBE00|nr:50S ribosomal protein L31 [Vibrio vulnificus]MDK2692310.1 50S ribosomal protein L31 [Vibrio vulnificus]
MKAGIHPEYKAVNATCSCGNSFVFNSTLDKESIHLDVCDKCHPFYTGKQRIVDTGGRADRFNKRFGALSSGKK